MFHDRMKLLKASFDFIPNLTHMSKVDSPCLEKTYWHISVDLYVDVGKSSISPNYPFRRRVGVWNKFKDFWGKVFISRKKIFRGVI